MPKKKNGKIAKRLYKCDDCINRFFLYNYQLDRASRPRCMACGCTRLNLVSDDAKDHRDVVLDTQRRHKENRQQYILPTPTIGIPK